MPNKLYYGDNLDVRREHVITLVERLGGKRPDIPHVDVASVKRAEREATGTQEKLL